MVKFCPNCGYKLENEFKFCPECGFNIEKVNESDNSLTNSSGSNKRDETGKLNFVICENCGEENDPANTECIGCGIKLKDSKQSESRPAVTKQSNSNTANSRGKKNSPKHDNKKLNRVKPQSNSGSNKKLSDIKIFAVVTVGLGIAIVILMFSGVFNSVLEPNNVTADSQTLNSSSESAQVKAQKMESLEAQIKNNPADTSAILQLAHMKNDSGLFKEAIVNYKEYLALVPKDPNARIDMGICYYNLQDYKTAMSEMEEALKIDPKHQIGYLDLGIVNLAAGNIERSRQMFKKAVELDPNSDYGKKAEELLKSHTTNQINNGGK